VGNFKQSRVLFKHKHLSHFEEVYVRRENLIILIPKRNEKINFLYQNQYFFSKLTKIVLWTSYNILSSCQINLEAKPTHKGSKKNQYQIKKFKMKKLGTKLRVNVLLSDHFRWSQQARNSWGMEKLKKTKNPKFLFQLFFFLHLSMLKGLISFHQKFFHNLHIIII